jgi:hypothetical protein
MLNQLVYHDEHVYKLWIRIEERRFGFCLSPFDLLRARSNKVRRRQLFLFLLSLSTRSLLENHDVLGCRANVCVLSPSHLSPSVLPPISFPSDSLARPLALQRQCTCLFCWPLQNITWLTYGGRTCFSAINTNVAVRSHVFLQQQMILYNFQRRIVRGTLQNTLLRLSQQGCKLVRLSSTRSSGN